MAGLTWNFVANFYRKARRLSPCGGIPVADAARGSIKRIDALFLSSNGTFWHAEGYKLLW
jgi:hypothetical protein